MTQQKRLRNSFQPSQPPVPSKIISEDASQVLAQRFKGLSQLYSSSVADNGYSPHLAYRFLIIALHNQQHKLFDIQTELIRFFDHCYASQDFEDVRMGGDLLLLPQTKAILTAYQFPLQRIHFLAALRKCYKQAGSAKESRKCSRTLLHYCRQILTRDAIRLHTETYSRILDSLITETKIRIARLTHQNRKQQAIEELTVFIQLLQKSELVHTEKYQLQLLQGYWALAQLHNQLHYLAYTRKYALIAMNIAQRTGKKSAQEELQVFLNRLA